VESSNSIRTRFLELTSFDTGGLGWPTGCAGLERAVRKKKRDQAALCKLEKMRNWPAKVAGLCAQE
jgi:hypothetical protein